MRWRRLVGSAGVGTILALSFQAPGFAQSVLSTGEAEQLNPPPRPTIDSQRWEENWSVLADPALRTGPLDALKYVPLTEDGSAYVSFGANARERIEAFDAPQFGTSHQASNTYLLDRIELSSDFRFGGWQAFVQLEDAEAPGKTVVTPADADRLDLEQAFVARVMPIDDGTLKIRIGRQEFGFDQQRFVSDRDGPNVRQAYDAIWVDYELKEWRIISFVSHPTQNVNHAAFDDFSGPNLSLSGFRVERRNLGIGDIAVYYLRYRNDDAKFIGASGNEIRNAFDVHDAGLFGPIDFDLEVMAQQGSIGTRSVLAWAVGERIGYTFKSIQWSPHLSVQFDAASGNHSASGTFGTFNPLFPNGSYFSLAGLTGDANLVHIKPIISVTPESTLLLQAAMGFQWRQTTDDAIYTFPVQPVANTAGRGSLWTGSYLQLDAVKQLNANVTVSAELVQYQVGSTIIKAGGHNTTYVNTQVSLAW